MEMVPLRWHRVSLGPFALALRGVSSFSLLPSLIAVPASGFAPGAIAFLAFFALAVAGITFLGRWRRRAGIANLEDGPSLAVSKGVLSARLRAAAIEDAYQASPEVIVLRARDGRVFDLAPDADDGGRAILEHLGATLARRTLTAPLRGVLGRFTKGLLAMIITPMIAMIAVTALHLSAVPGLLLVAALTLLAMGWIPRRFDPRVVLGADGIRILGGLRERFYPYREMVNVLGGRHAVSLGLGLSTLVIATSRGQVTLPTIGQSTEQVEALRRRIEDGIAAAHRGTADAFATLERGGRTIAEWRDALRRIAVVGGGFREATLGRDELEGVLADASAPIERRVGAGLALRALDDDARDRIRVAAETSASPRVRVALDAAASEEIEDSALESALAASDPIGGSVRA